MRRGTDNQGRTADIVTIYWVTQTISSSSDVFGEPAQLWVMGKDEKVPARRAWPCFQEIARPPSVGRAVVPILRWEEMPRGGHFAAIWKNPSCWAGGRAFFRSSIMCITGACSAGKSTRAGVVAPVGLWHVRYFSGRRS